VNKRFKGKKNPDLWLRFLEVYKKHKVQFVWVKGHADNPWNERCDQLAVAASLGQHLQEDTGYFPD
jgi:ribonuclease HI